MRCLVVLLLLPLLGTTSANSALRNFAPKFKHGADMQRLTSRFSENKGQAKAKGCDPAEAAKIQCSNYCSEEKIDECKKMGGLANIASIGFMREVPNACVCKDCSKIEARAYTSLTNVEESEVGSGTPPFMCVDWYDATLAGTVQKDTDLSAGGKDAIQAPMLGGHGYAGDGKYSANLNNLLSGRKLAEWNQPSNGKEGWNIYGADVSWPNQILEFAKRFATALNQLPDTKTTTYRGGWSKRENMEAMKIGDVQNRPGFTSMSSDKAWCQGFAHDFHYPRSGERGDMKEPGWVSVVTTIHTKRAKDIRGLNPRESELVLLPNSRLKVVDVKLTPNMPFATYTPAKVAAFLKKFTPPMTKSAANVVAKKITGDMILSAFAQKDVWAATELVCGPGKDTECGYDENYKNKHVYKDADGKEQTLGFMLRAGKDQKPVGEDKGMFEQQYAPLAAAGRALNVFSKVGMFYAVEMEELV